MQRVLLFDGTLFGLSFIHGDICLQRVDYLVANHLIRQLQEDLDRFELQKVQLVQRVYNQQYQ